MYLDTDVLISPIAPNIFNIYNKKLIAVVSQVKNLYQPLKLTLRKLAFLRHTFISKKYPLDSALFMSAKKILKSYSSKNLDNYFCAGIFLFNVKNHSNFMRKCFERYSRSTRTLTGGDEPILNYEFQAKRKLQWLPYEFHALWTYEVAWKYPFLFEKIKNKRRLIMRCLESSLHTNHFLHFAGSWYESQMWKIGKIFESKKSQKIIKNFKKYLSKKLTGKPKGLIKPKTLKR